VTADGRSFATTLGRPQATIDVGDSPAVLNDKSSPEPHESLLTILEHGYGISAKRYALYEHDRETVRLIKVSEHGLGLYYRPKEGRDSGCEVALWIKEGWQWILNQAMGISADKPDWLSVPVMRRIAITTPNVMVALRRLNRDKARPYNFALSPVLVNVNG
jgi:hypothetical protein